MMRRLKRLIPLLNRRSCLSGLAVEAVPKTDGSEDLYPRRVPQGTEASGGRRREQEEQRIGLPTHLLGRQLGVAFRGEKVHVIREVSYSSSRFLCGAKKADGEPLIVATSHTDLGEICGTCNKLAKKGAA